MTTLRDRLVDLAEDAPTDLPAGDLWAAGVRRSRRRRALGALAAAIVVVAVGAGSLVVHGPVRTPDPVGPPPSGLHLPRTVYPPSGWADGTDDTGAPGPLAAVGITRRNVRHGLWDTWDSLAPFGVSAVDGSAVFLDLPGGVAGAALDSLTISPDGTKVGYRRRDPGRRSAVFAVYDTVTGRTRALRASRWGMTSPLDSVDIRFTGDSQHLVTTMTDRSSSARSRRALVVWDLATGRPVVAEPAGRAMVPNLGSAPHGVVWSRGRDTFTFDPATGATTSVRTPFEVVEASYGPDGRAFAAIAFGKRKAADWRLYLGPSPSRLRRVHLDITPDQLLGWRDATHVLVRAMPGGETAEVDLSTGAARSLGLAAARPEYMLPAYAADLWANPLVPGTRPPHVHDPRLPRWIAGGGGIPLVLLGGLWWRRRRGRA